MLRATLATLSDHWEVTTGILITLVMLSCIASATFSSLWSDTAKTVCFAHHSPAECDPKLRVKTPEETNQLNQQYMQCLKDHVGYSTLCLPIYQH